MQKFWSLFARLFFFFSRSKRNTRYMRYTDTIKVRYECRPMVWVRVFETCLSCVRATFLSDCRRCSNAAAKRDVLSRLFHRILSTPGSDNVAFEMRTFISRDRMSSSGKMGTLDMYLCRRLRVSRVWYYNVQNAFDVCASFLRLSSTTPLPFERTAARRRAGRRPDPVCTRRAVE